jgi:S1-C subfamily serine protease
MENEKKFSKFFWLIIIALIFGLGGGVIGQILSRVFVLQDAYNVPLFGDISVPGNIYNGSSLVIESPRKVIVEQDTKISETINSARRNIVGIFRKLESTKNFASSSSFKLSETYDLNRPLAEGFIVTSDGWIMSTYVPEELAGRENEASSSKKNLPYVVIASDMKIYEVEEVRGAKDAQVFFWRISAKDLGVKPFKKIADMNEGQIAVAVNFRGQSFVSTINSKYPSSLPAVLSSDRSLAELQLSSRPEKSFSNSFLFNISGDLLAIASTSGAYLPAFSQSALLSSLIESKNLSKPYLGINYIDNSRFFNPKNNSSKGVIIYPDQNGVAIKKGSPAEKAGLKPFDLILQVNTMTLDEKRHLNDIVSEMQSGDSLDLLISREGKEMRISLILGALKID